MTSWPNLARTLAAIPTWLLVGALVASLGYLFLLFLRLLVRVDELEEWRREKEGRR